MRRECRERFSRHPGLAIPTCITVRAWRTYRDACRDSYPAVCFDVGGRENVPGIPSACATHHFTYLVRGPCRQTSRHMWHDVANMYRADDNGRYVWFEISVDSSHSVNTFVVEMTSFKMTEENLQNLTAPLCTDLQSLLEAHSSLFHLSSRVFEVFFEAVVGGVGGVHGRLTGVIVGLSFSDICVCVDLLHLLCNLGDNTEIQIQNFYCLTM